MVWHNSNISRHTWMLAFCPRASVRLPDIGLWTNNGWVDWDRFQIAICNGVCCTHFPYSSLLNFGRGEAPLAFCTNGFSNCAFWRSLTALLNMATFDESGDSCAHNKRKTKRKTDKSIVWLSTTEKRKKNEPRLFTAADDTARCTAKRRRKLLYI